MADPELYLPYQRWPALLDAIGPRYSRDLLDDVLRIRAELAGVDEDDLVGLAAAGQKAARSLDLDGARLTLRLHDERDRASKAADRLRQEADEIEGSTSRSWSRAGRAQRRAAEAAAADRRTQAEESWQRARVAQEEIRALDAEGRHLFKWFERNRAALAAGLAADQHLNLGATGAYRVLGAPGIASLTAQCVNADRMIDLRRLGALVEECGDQRQELLFAAAISIAGREGRAVTLAEVTGELDGEDLDRVLEGIAIRRERGFRGSSDSPVDLWIRAAEPSHKES